MASAHHHHASSSSSKRPKMDSLSLPPPHPHSQPLKIPNTTTRIGDKNPNPTTTTTIPNATSPTPSLDITPSPEDLYLSNSSHLSRQEVLKLRSHRLKQLSKCYRDQYWALMEDLRVQYRDYVWKYGMSPFRQDEEKGSTKDGCDGIIEGSGETNANANNLLCVFYGCKLKAMALTNFCQLHILSDSKQQLYKPCDFVIKSAQAGPITCGKPILRSTVPALCSVHFQKAQKHVTRALKKAGLNVSSSSKLAPKFHVVVTEYVRQIQAKRRAALRINKNNVLVNQESGS
ncbi:uncharacterized protein LOC132275411 [Cornus florida]|uniref:uncharacterized protein LOC132275411 n=1 Tax=Cornus florida TaxID=4283 RepID=UPI00289CA9D8|nr:uncharacterized protein LOC132275411 [Cornus florida]